MSSLLYAVGDGAPAALETPPGAHGFDGLYAGLETGVYEALRTYAKVRFLDLDEHLARMRRSIERLGWDYRFDEARMRRSIGAVCSASPYDEMRVRFDVLAEPARARGSNARELIALAPFTPPPPQVYTQGVAVVTTDALSRSDPLAKTAAFVEQRRRIEQSTPDVYERLIADAHGTILEGFSSNFYVVRDGVLVTAGEGVLEGVTRRIVLELARRRGVPVALEAPHRDDLRHVQEAAISSSSRGLVPVVRIDDIAIGDGRPGPLIRALGADYEAYVLEASRPAS